MRTPDRIKVSFGLTLNLGNYESLRLEGGRESDMEPGESFNDAWTRLQEEVMMEVMTTGHNMRKKISAGRDTVDSYRTRMGGKKTT